MSYVIEYIGQVYTHDEVKIISQYFKELRKKLETKSNSNIIRLALYFMLLKMQGFSIQTLLLSHFNLVTNTSY